MQPVGTNHKEKLIPARLKLLFRGSTGFYCREETIKLQEEGEKKKKKFTEVRAQLTDWLWQQHLHMEPMRRYLLQRWRGSHCGQARRGVKRLRLTLSSVAGLRHTSGRKCFSCARRRTKKIFLCKFPYFAICWFSKICSIKSGRQRSAAFGENSHEADIWTATAGKMWKARNGGGHNLLASTLSK